jgi:hypothetical protein
LPLFVLHKVVFIAVATMLSSKHTPGRGSLEEIVAEKIHYKESGFGIMTLV